MKVVPCRFQHCLEPFSMLAVELCFETRLCRHFPNHVFQKKKWSKWSNKANVAKHSERVFCFLDNCIWMDCFRLSLLPREYLTCFAVNVLTNSSKISHITKRDILLLHFPQSGDKIDVVQIKAMFETL